MRSFGRIARFLIATTVVSAALVAPAAAARRTSATVPSLQLMAAHPWAQATATATGRQLIELESFNGRIYAGYGDYTANSGPTTIASIGAGETAFTAEAVSGTEAIYNYRQINGKLYAPATDPVSSTDFAVSGEAWSDRTGMGAWHAFDMATLTGTDLWTVGSQGYDAVAWRSVDGGATWQESLRVQPAAGGGYSRFYFAGVLAGKLYVQAHDANLGAQAKSMVFDGTSWTSGPALISGSEPGWRPVEFKGSLVFSSWGQGFSSSIKRFDGRRVTTIGHGYDVEVDGGALHVLGATGTVSKTVDFRKFSTVATSSSAARSLEVVGNDVYVGTAAGELLAGSIPG